nr:leucine-rich repeat-containing protein 56 isoform X3 [Globicephala melas]
MDQAWDRAHGPRPSIASVRVRALSWQGRHKPRPQSKAPGSHSGRLPEEHLSPARLQALAQVDDLRLVSVLELCVNTHENSLGNFGLHLPNLSQLKLNGSCLGSLRDLGTSLGRLQVLWLARCGLADLDGIGSFPALKELYLSYNDVSDLSPLCLLEQLEVLDLEGNCVQDPGQLRYLQLCPRLATLTLEGNPLCLWPGPGPAHQVPQGYNYRAEVRKLVPQLQVLDELPATHTRLTTSRKLDHDWLVVKEAIKEGSVLDSLLPGLGTDGSRPGASGWGCPRRGLHPPHPWPRPQVLPTDPPFGDAAPSYAHLRPSAGPPGPGPAPCWSPGAPCLQAFFPRAQPQRTTPAASPTAGAHPERLPPPGPEDLAARASAPGPDPADSRHLLASASLPALRELRLRPLPSRCLESREEAAAAPGGPQRGPEEEQDEAGPTTRPRPPSLAPEPSRTLGYNLTPSPPKSLMPSDRGSSSWGSTDLQFRGRHLRALGSLGPGLGQGLAAVTALRALEVASGPSPRAEGCPGPKPAPDPAARPPASSACRT